MASTDIVFSGSIPEFYDSHMVPLIFQPYADLVAARVAALAPMAVIETAAGTGVVPRALSPLLPPGARYVVTDLNQPMLDHAARVHPPGGRIEWRAADALDLPFADGTFDVAVCQFGAMFFPDRTRGFAEARRVLRAGGHSIVCTWDRIGTNDFTEVVEDAVAATFPADPPRFFTRTPHGYHDTARIRADLEAAGYARVSVETVEAVSRAPSARHVAVALCHGTPMRNEILARDPDALDRVTDAATRALEGRYGTGPIAARITAHIATAVA